MLSVKTIDFSPQTELRTCLKYHLVWSLAFKPVTASFRRTRIDVVLRLHTWNQLFKSCSFWSQLQSRGLVSSEMALWRLCDLAKRGCPSPAVVSLQGFGSDARLASAWNVERRKRTSFQSKGIRFGFVDQAMQITG